MTSTITFRPTTHDLAVINAHRGPGDNVSDVLRAGLKALERLSLQERMRRESAAIMSDPGEVAEIEQIQAEMGDLRAW